MKKAFGILLLLFIQYSPGAEKPLSLHPDNPHYFLFRGKPTPLITSAEHYGAVLNPDFDYTKYLDELKAHGFNLTRVFTGVYCEDTKSFGIARNTLAPKEGKLLCPWARSDKPGYSGGGNKFDLGRFDEEYFTRLKAFMSKAAERGIVVELVLFCPFYEDSMWNLSPMNSANNINGIGAVSRQSVYDFKKNGNLQTLQETLVKKLAVELNGFDNLYFEICNEPYFGGVTEDWQTQIIYVLADTEKMLPNKHLISLNIANGSKKVAKPNSAVSILNFHYTSPPTAVKENYALNRVIGENETGFKGTGDTHYRMEAWEFLLAGGGLYNNLDYSFAAGHEDGTFVYPAKSPGGGNLGFRRQIAFLKRFLEGFDLLSMKPDETVIRGGLTGKSRATVLSEPGKQYAAYFFNGPVVKPKFALPDGIYKVEWYSPVTGKVLKAEPISAKGSPVELVSPQFETDMVLRIKAAGLDETRFRKVIDGKNGKNDGTKPLNAKELTGKWVGKAENKNGIRLLAATMDFDIKKGGDVKWLLRYETEESGGAEIGVAGFRVENATTGRVDLHFKESVLGHLERGEGGTILLTILPIFENRNMPGERVFRRFEKLALQRVE